MRTVYKYSLPKRPGVYELNTHAGAKPAVVVQQGINLPVIYLQVNTNNPECTLRLEVTESGREIKTQTFPYVGTVLLNSGGYVLHYFLERKG